MKVQDSTELYRRTGKDSAGRSRTVQDSAEQYRTLQDSAGRRAGQIMTVHDSKEQYRTVQDRTQQGDTVQSEEKCRTVPEKAGQWK